MVYASRCRSVMHIKLNFCLLCPPVNLAVVKGRKHSLPFARMSPHWLSSITNSRESTSIIMSMPPGKTLFVVISRSLWECHIKAQPRSLAGLSWRLAGCRVVQFAFAVPAQAGIVARKLASGPKYGEPLYQGPLVKTFGSGNVTGPPAATSPNGLTCTGLLWSWHHSMKFTAVGALEL